MATLTTAVDGDDLYLVVSDLPTTHFIQLDDEIVEVEAEFATTYDRATGETEPNKLRVLRAALGTTAASHSGAVTLVPVYGAGAGGGGSLTLDNTVDPPAEVATIIAPGATIAGDEASLANFVQSSGNESVSIVAGTVDTQGGDIDLGAIRTRIRRWTSLIGTPQADLELQEGSVTLTHVGAATAQLALNGDDSATLDFSGGGSVYLDTAGAEVNFGAKQLAVNADGVKMTGLPTVNPNVAGQLWNDAGTLKVSAG